MSKEFESLLERYWDLAYLEGKSGLSMGDKANDVLNALRKMEWQPEIEYQERILRLEGALKKALEDKPSQIDTSTGTQVSKVWWDGEKLMAKPITLEDFYKPAQQHVSVTDELVDSYCKAWAQSFAADNPYHTMQMTTEDRKHIEAGLKAALVELYKWKEAHLEYVRKNPEPPLIK